MSTSSKYTFYEIIKNYRNTQKNDLLNNSLNGICGGLFGSVFSHPFDLWKNYKQRNQSFDFKNYKIYYQGYSGSILKNIVLYSCLFPIYDFYHNKFNNNYIAAPLTSITVSTIIQPFDYYKTIKMANNKGTNFFRGYTLMIARSIPHFLITMEITNKIKKSLNK